MSDKILYTGGQNPFKGLIELLTCVHPETGELVTEYFKAITGYEDSYEVSTFGRVRNIKKGTLLQGNINKKGYVQVTLSRNNTQMKFRLHRLVMVTHEPNPNNYPVINHKDTDKLNNKVWNLEWCDDKHNYNHAMEMGLVVHAKGSNHSHAKLTENDIPVIRQFYKDNSSYKIAAQYGVDPSVIRDIVKGRIWKHVK